MTANESVLRDFSSSTPLARARIASWLLQHPDEISTQDLMAALQSESVAQIRRTLLEVLKARQRSSLGQSGSASEEVEGADPHAPDDGRGDIAALVQHELSPAVGWIKLAADSDISGGFTGSRTEEAVRRLQLRIDGLVNLIKSQTHLTVTKVRLPLAITHNWPDPTSKPRITPDASAATVEIETDEGLFSLLLSNVFQNAIDASLEASGTSSADISWGFTAESYWIRVTNSFSGEKLTLADVAGDGASSKLGHQGRGLALIRDVARRLGISIDLEGASGSASFTLTGRVRSE